MRRVPKPDTLNFPGADGPFLHLQLVIGVGHLVLGSHCKSSVANYEIFARAEMEAFSLLAAAQPATKTTDKRPSVTKPWKRSRSFNS